MTILEINKEREALKRLEKSAREVEQERYELLNVEEAKAKKELTKKIKKHFRGIKVQIYFGKTNLTIKTKKQTILEHKYGSTKFEDVEPSLVKTILSEYEEVYGEVQEEILYEMDWSLSPTFITPEAYYGGIR